MSSDEIRLARIVAAARAGMVRFGPHSQRQMRTGRIMVAEIEAALRGTIEIIEDYPGDVRGPSFLVLGWSGERPLHLVLTDSPRPFVITIYDPRTQAYKWSADFRRRVSP